MTKPKNPKIRIALALAGLPWVCAIRAGEIHDAVKGGRMNEVPQGRASIASGVSHWETDRKTKAPTGRQ